MEPTCKQRWKACKDSRVRDLRRLIDANNAGEGSSTWDKVYADIGSLYEYGLALDYVPVGTFSDQKRSYWRYQLSYGGPSDEFRFYGEDLGEFKAHLEYVTYAFLDWGDGHVRQITGKDLDVMRDLFDSWADCGSLRYLKEEALK